MLAGLIVDAVLLLIFIAVIRGGWVQGALASALSAVGLIAGLIIGMGITPLIMNSDAEYGTRFGMALAFLIALIGMGYLIGALLGVSVRDRLNSRTSMRVDSFVGSIMQLLLAMLLCWLIALPLATVAGPKVGEAVRSSYILNGLNAIAPESLQPLPNRLSALLSESGMPPLISPFDAEPAEDVAAPNIEIEDAELVERVRPSVVHVMGQSSQCHRRLMGSGFVVAPNYILTNAHVVAGTDSVALDTVLGIKQADVVYYDPEFDIALVHSPELGLDALSWADQPAEVGADAIVMGHPESGPFEAAPARVADRILISGSDIYAQGRVERESYAVRGTIREGNSGGPLLNTEGEVLGLVFGAARDSTDIGFALTASQVQQVIGNVASYTTPVDTQACV